MRIRYDFGDLEAFVALSEADSFARAAERLHISQSALSRRIQKLEAALDVALFERTTRSVAATAQGRAFLDYAKALLADADQASRAVGGDRRTAGRMPTAIITVAAVPTATQSLLPRAIRRFRENGQDARLRIKDVNADGVVDAVLAGEADFGVGFLSAREPNLDFQALVDDPFVLVLEKDDPLCASEVVQWVEIDPERFISIWRGSGNRLLIEASLARERITLDWSYEVQHLSTALGLVEAGLGMTALPQSAIPAATHAALATRKLTNPLVVRSIGLARRKRTRLSPAAEAFYQTIFSEMDARLVT